ncbi:MAG: hypothetical protein IKJ74_00340 [Clostridia bacterium]|nr:hypothetical protein [Clostridia bacterium]
MKNWAYTWILCSLLTMLARILLPRGERSPLFGTVKFLISLLLIFTVASPVIRFVKGEWKDAPLPLAEAASERADIAPEEIILEKSSQRILKSARDAFPDATFTLKILADEASIPTGIRVLCENEKTGKEIARFLEMNFKILTTYEGKESV